MNFVEKIGEKQTGNGLLSFSVDKGGAFFNEVNLTLLLKDEYLNVFNNLQSEEEESVSSGGFEIDEKYNIHNLERFLIRKGFKLKMYFADQLVMESEAFDSTKSWNFLSQLNRERQGDNRSIRYGYSFSLDIGFLISSDKLRFEVDFGNHEATKIFDKEFSLSWDGYYEKKCFVKFYKRLDPIGGNKVHTFFADEFYLRKTDEENELENQYIIYNDYKIDLRSFVNRGYFERGFELLSERDKQYIPHKLEFTQLHCDIIGGYVLHNEMTSYMNVLYLELKKKRLRELQMGTLSVPFVNEYYSEEMPYRLDYQGLSILGFNVQEEYFMKNPVRHKGMLEEKKDN